MTQTDTIDAVGSQLDVRAPQTPVRLDLGCGDVRIPGFIPLDVKLGSCIYPLPYPDGSVAEIRASHVLEHFGHAEVLPVLRDWVRVLEPGGLLRIAVPNMRWIAEKYLGGEKEPIGPYLMGGQVDEYDYHKTCFDQDRLCDLMLDAGLVGIGGWVSEAEDCASLPVSLNLQGRKSIGVSQVVKTAMVMSVPRLGFTDNMFCAIRAAQRLGIGFHRVTGAFWGQCLERAIEDVIDGSVEVILTVDYDTVFTPDQVLGLADILRRHPEVDAIAPIQVKRGLNAFLMGLLKSDGTPYEPGTEITLKHFAPEIVRAGWAHFGLTMLRVSALKKMSKPWFLGVPAPNGGWGDGRVDDDIYFWKKWTASGNSLYLASRIPVGHGQLMFSFPGHDGIPIHLYPDEYFKGGPPTGVWR